MGRPGVISNADGPVIQLADGTLFPYLHPAHNPLGIETIAAALSKICRFGGHATLFNSVAQHCVLVSRLVPPNLALTGLMHDASEAFVGDLPSPLKDTLDYLAPGVFSKLEGDIHKALAQQYGFEFPYPMLIKLADTQALATERRDFMRAGEAWPNLPPPVPKRIRALSPARAERAFLRRYYEVKDRHAAR